LATFFGVLAESSPTDHFVAVFRQALRELGYTEGQNLVIEYRYAEGSPDPEWLCDLATELVRLTMDVIVATGEAIRAAQEATRTRLC